MYTYTCTRMGACSRDIQRYAEVYRGIQRYCTPGQGACSLSVFLQSWIHKEVAVPAALHKPVFVCLHVFSSCILINYSEL